MAKIENLTPGQILYSVIRRKAGNTNITIGALFEIEVVSVSEDLKFVFARKNGNPPKNYTQSQVKSWKVTKPKPKTTIMGMLSY